MENHFKNSTEAVFHQQYLCGVLSFTYHDHIITNEEILQISDSKKLQEIMKECQICLASNSLCLQYQQQPKIMRQRTQPGGKAEDMQTKQNLAPNIQRTCKYMIIKWEETENVMSNRTKKTCYPVGSGN